MTTTPLTSHLLQKDIWSPRFSKPQNLHYLTLSGSVEGGTLTMLVFPDQSKRPALVLRLLRDESELPHFLNERDVLLQFQTLGPVLKNSVPRLLFCENREDLWMLGESVVEGAPLKTIEELDLTFVWLLAMARETQKAAALSWSKAAEDIIAEFQKHFTVSNEEQDFFREMQEALQAYAPATPMTYLVHGDFSRHNLFISKPKTDALLAAKLRAFERSCEHGPRVLGDARPNDSVVPPLGGTSVPEIWLQQGIPLQVIDWMSARWSPFPLFDACLLLTTFWLHNREGPGLQGYLKVFSERFFTPTDFSRLTKEKLLSLSAAVGADPKLLPFFFGLFLIEQAVLETRRMLFLSKRGYIPRGAIYRGSSENYDQALKNQIWTELFHFFVAHRSSFLKNT